MTANTSLYPLRLQEDYIIDELPLYAFYGVLTIYAACWLADNLSEMVSPKTRSQRREQ